MRGSDARTAGQERRPQRGVRRCEAVRVRGVDPGVQRSQRLVPERPADVGTWDTGGAQLLAADHAVLLADQLLHEEGKRHAAERAARHADRPRP